MEEKIYPEDFFHCFIAFENWKFRWNRGNCIGSFHKSVLLATDVAASNFFLNALFVAEMLMRSLLSCGLYKQEYTVSFAMTLGYSF